MTTYQSSESSSFSEKEIEVETERKFRNIESNDERIEIGCIKVESSASEYSLDGTFVDVSERLQGSEDELIEEDALFSNDPLSTEGNEEEEEKEKVSYSSSINIRPRKRTHLFDNTDQSKEFNRPCKRNKDWSPLTPCLNNCHILINEDNQKRIFDSYWELKTNELRSNFLSEMIKLIPRLHFDEKSFCEKQIVAKYYLKTDDGQHEFCRSCFREILRERDPVMTAVLEKGMYEIISLQKFAEAQRRVKCKIQNAIHSSANVDPLSTETIQEADQTSSLVSADIPVKIWTRIPPCSHKCYLRITEDEQKQILDSYWDKIKSKTKFIYDLIEIFPNTKPCRSRKWDVSYYLNTCKKYKKVCRQCFRLTLSEPDYVIKNILEQKVQEFIKSTEKLKPEINKCLVDEAVLINCALKQLPPCIENCHLKIKVHDLKLIFISYWEQSTKDSRFNLMNEMIEIVENSERTNQYEPRFYLNTQEGRKEVCETCFRSAFCEREKQIVKVIEHKIKNGIYEKNCQPNEAEEANSLNLSTEQLREVEEHMKKFPLCETKCETCKIILVQLRFLKNKKEKIRIREYQTCHLSNANMALQSRLHDETITKTLPTLIVSSFGFKQSLPTPYLYNSEAFYKKSLWTYNFTIEQVAGQNKVMKNPKFFMWHETQGKKTANEMASCLYQYLQNIPEDVKYVIFYSTTSCRESRSKAIANMFSYCLTNHQTLESIEHKFLVDGHSEVGKNLGNIWMKAVTKKNQGKIQVPQDWYNAFNKPVEPNIYPEVVVMTPEMFYDFESLWKDEFSFDEDVKWLRYTKEGLVKIKKTWPYNDEFQIINLKEQFNFKNLKRKELRNLKSESITKGKKKALLEMFNLMNLTPSTYSQVKQFYEKLPVANSPTETGFDSCIIKEEIDIEI